MELPKKKAKPEFKIAEDFLDLRTLNSNALIDQIEENIKMREMSVEKQFRFLGKKQKL